MIRALSALVLSLLLAFASVTMAVARVQSRQVGQITICSGYGVVSIAVDAEGNPVGPVHPCPDCLAGLAVALVPAALSLPEPAAQAAGLVLPATEPGGGQSHLNPRARGPPLPV